MSDLREKFRPVATVVDIHQIKDHDPAYDYKNVIFTYRHDPRNVEKHEARGWEVVMTTEPSVDDRSFTPNSKEKKLRPQECITTTRDNHKQVLMRVLKSTRAANAMKDKEHRDQMQLAEAKRRGEKVVRRGNEVITKGTELNEGFRDDAPESINFNEI